MQELDQSVIDVTVMMGEGFNFYVTEGVACGRSESECLEDPWISVTNAQVFALDAKTYHEVSWQPGTWEVFEVSKEAWNEFQNTRG